MGGEEVHHIFWKIQFNENLRSSVPPPIVKRSELGGSPSRGTDFPRKNRFLVNYEGLSVRVTVDLLTFCLVTIFNVESQETELELEQCQKKFAIPVFMKELGKYIQKKLNKYVTVNIEI